MKIMVCALAIVVLCAGAASAQAPVADYFSTTSTYNGAPLPEGMTIEAYDQDGIRCGYAEANEDGSFLIHVYGNDPMTPQVDEGAREGEVLEWRVNGIPTDAIEWLSNLIGLFADLRFENGAAKEVRFDTIVPVGESTWGEVKSIYQ